MWAVKFTALFTKLILVPVAARAELYQYPPPSPQPPFYHKTSPPLTILNLLFLSMFLWWALCHFPRTAVPATWWTCMVPSLRQSSSTTSGTWWPSSSSGWRPWSWWSYLGHQECQEDWGGGRQNRLHRGWEGPRGGDIAGEDCGGPRHPQQEEVAWWKGQGMASQGGNKKGSQGQTERSSILWLRIRCTSPHLSVGGTRGYGDTAKPMADQYRGPYRVIDRGNKAWKIQVGDRDSLKPHLGVDDPPGRLSRGWLQWVLWFCHLRQSWGGMCV